jgi:hypothetical protein
MEIPEAFRAMCWKLNQDDARKFSSLDEIIEHLIAGLTSSQLGSIKSYIDELLRENPSDRHLMGIWRKAGADLLISSADEGGVSEFFAMIRSSIVERQNADG